jgi:mannitol/fructose-specific phosphotransferase system IIA component (Ntr-type)
MSEQEESPAEFCERVGKLCWAANANHSDLINVESHVDTIEDALSIITELLARLEKCEEFRVKAVEAMESVQFTGGYAVGSGSAIRNECTIDHVKLFAALSLGREIEAGKHNQDTKGTA